MTSQRTTAIGIFAVVIIVLYWFLIRPPRIRAECYRQSLYTWIPANDPTGKQVYRPDGQFSDTPRYNKCLRLKGMEP